MRHTVYTKKISFSGSLLIVVVFVYLQGPTPSPRAAHAAIRFGNVVYLFGGRHGDRRMNDLHMLDLETLMWSGE